MISRRAGPAATTPSSIASSPLSANFRPASVNSPDSSRTSATGAAAVPGGSGASHSRRGKRRAGGPLRVVTGLLAVESHDDDACDLLDDDDRDSKRREKKNRRRFGWMFWVQLLRRYLSPFFGIPILPREGGKSSSPVVALVKHWKLSTRQRSTAVGSLLLVVSMVAATIWIACGRGAFHDERRWGALFLTRLRGRRIESVSRASELLLLLRPSIQRHDVPRPSTVHLPAGSDAYGDRGEPNYGGLNIRILEEEGEARRIYRDWALREGKYDRPRPTDDTNDYYYSLDDDDLRNTYRGWGDDTIHEKKRCRRTSWHRNAPVNCNSFHELDVRTAAQHRGFRRVGAGSYKHVFIVNTTSTSGVPELLVFKNFGVAAKFDTKNYERMRKDVLVAERVGPHRLIVDVYGYCGLAQLDEAMPNGGLENVATPSLARRRYRIKLNDTDRLDPQNSLLPSEKLAIALDMFEAVALLHNHPGGVIVHDDIQLLQFLLTPDRKHVKLNDFNRMEVMLWEDKDQAYCRYRNGPGQGDWRSPEEYQDLPLDEKIDVFSLGNNLFSILTGLSPFYSASGYQEVQRLVVQGAEPYIDPRWKERSFAERTIVELIQRCLAHDPGDRIDVGAAVRLLRDAIRTNKLRHLHEDKRV